MTKIDTKYQEYAVCPWCGCKDVLGSWELEDGGIMKDTNFFKKVQKACPWFYRFKGEPLCIATVNKEFKYHCCQKNCAPFQISKMVLDSGEK